MGIPLPAMLMTVVAVGCIAVALVAFLPMYFMSTTTTSEMGEELIESSTRGSINDLRHNFEVAVSGVNLMDMIIDRSSGGGGNALNEQKIIGSFMELLATVASKGVNYLSFATADKGHFWGLEVTTSGRVFWRVRNDSYPCRTEFSVANGFDNTNITLVPTGAVSCSYEPRARGWYKALNKSDVDVTAAYPYTSAAQLAMTFGRQIRYPNGTLLGVITTDVSTGSVSALLAANTFGRTGDAFVVEAQTHTTLATSIPNFPLLSNYQSTSGGATTDVTPVESLKAKFAQVALSVAPQLILSKAFVDTRAKSDGFWVSVRDLKQTPSMHWRLIIVVPTNDYFSSVNQSRNMTIGITVAMVVVVILLAVLIQPLILIPLGLLRDQVSRAANLELDLDSLYDTNTCGDDLDDYRDLSAGTRPKKTSLDEIEEKEKKQRRKERQLAMAADKNRSIITEIDQLQDRVDQLSNAIVSFTRFIPKEVVRDMLAAGRGVAELGMEPTHLCVLFSDIVAFTSICESVSPEDLNQLLSAYFSHCVRILMRHNATVDKFIGDAIMAFWGAPIPNDNAEVWACLAALHMQSVIEKSVGPVFAKFGQNVAARIGINSGTALVGNIGSTERISYTALGDTVNVAARLEGSNKLFNSSVLISNSTREFISDKNFLLRSLGKIAVVGREAPLPVYEVHCVISDHFIDASAALQPNTTTTATGVSAAHVFSSEKATCSYSQSDFANNVAAQSNTGHAVIMIQQGAEICKVANDAQSMASFAPSDSQNTNAPTHKQHDMRNNKKGDGGRYQITNPKWQSRNNNTSRRNSMSNSNLAVSQSMASSSPTNASPRGGGKHGHCGAGDLPSGSDVASSSQNSNNSLARQRLAEARRRRGVFDTIAEAFAEVKKSQIPLTKLEKSAVVAFNEAMVAYQCGPQALSEALRLFKSCKELLEAVPSDPKRKIRQAQATITYDPQWSERASAVLSNGNYHSGHGGKTFSVDGGTCSGVTAAGKTFTNTPFFPNSVKNNGNVKSTTLDLAPYLHTAGRSTDQQQQQGQMLCYSVAQSECESSAEGPLNFIGKSPASRSLGLSLNNVMSGVGGGGPSHPLTVSNLYSPQQQHQQNYHFTTVTGAVSDAVDGAAPQHARVSSNYVNNSTIDVVNTNTNLVPIPPTSYQGSTSTPAVLLASSSCLRVADSEADKLAANLFHENSINNPKNKQQHELMGSFSGVHKSVFSFEAETGVMPFTSPIRENPPGSMMHAGTATKGAPPSAAPINIRKLHTSVICPLFLSKMIALCLAGEWVEVIQQQEK